MTDGELFTERSQENVKAVLKALGNQQFALNFERSFTETVKCTWISSRSQTVQPCINLFVQLKALRSCKAIKYMICTER